MILGRTQYFGNLGIDPDFSTLSIKSGRIVDSIDSAEFIQQSWLTEDTQREGGIQLASGNYANPFNSKAGGGMPINSTLPLNVDNVDKYTDEQDRVWLKSGVLETDLVTYPDMTTINVVASGSAWDIGAVAGNGFCPMVWDGTHWWFIQDAVTDVAHQFDANFVHTGTSTNLTNMSRPYGLTWDGTHFYVVDSGGTDYLTKYDASWTYVTRTSISGVAPSPFGVALVGDKLVVSTENSNTVQVFDTDLTFLFSMTLSGLTTTASDGIAYDPDSEVLWLINNSDDIWYRFNMKPTDLVSGATFEVVSKSSVDETSLFGAAVKDGKLYSKFGADVYEYDSAGGIGEAKIDTDTGLPIYVRIL